MGRFTKCGGRAPPAPRPGRSWELPIAMLCESLVGETLPNARDKPRQRACGRPVHVVESDHDVRISRAHCLPDLAHKPEIEPLRGPAECASGTRASASTMCSRAPCKRDVHHGRPRRTPRAGAVRERGVPPHGPQRRTPLPRAVCTAGVRIRVRSRDRSHGRQSRRRQNRTRGATSWRCACEVGCRNGLPSGSPGRGPRAPRVAAPQSRAPFRPWAARCRQTSCRAGEDKERRRDACGVQHVEDPFGRSVGKTGSPSAKLLEALIGWPVVKSEDEADPGLGLSFARDKLRFPRRRGCGCDPDREN